MKMKLARKIIAAVAHGELFPLHILRKASTMVGSPIKMQNLIYHPKNMNKTYFECINYENGPVSTILPEGSFDENDYDYCFKLETNPGTLVLDVMAGETISSASKEAVSFAKYLKAEVQFKFNGIVVQANPFTQWDCLSNFYSQECDRKREEYLNSDEGKADAERRIQEVQEKQNILDRLINELPNIIKSEAEIMSWAKSFAEVADDNGVHIWYDSLADYLESEGWINGACVGNVNNKETMAKWIMGQFVSCLRSGMPPHPICAKFVDDYENMAA